MACAGRSTHRRLPRSPLRQGVHPNGRHAGVRSIHPCPAKPPKDPHASPGFVGPGMGLVARAGKPAPCSSTLEPGGLPLAICRVAAGSRPEATDSRLARTYRRRRFVLLHMRLDAISPEWPPHTAPLTPARGTTWQLTRHIDQGRENEHVRRSAVRADVIGLSSARLRKRRTGRLRRQIYAACPLTVRASSARPRRRQPVPLRSRFDRR